MPDTGSEFERAQERPSQPKAASEDDADDPPTSYCEETVRKYEKMIPCKGCQLKGTFFPFRFVLFPNRYWWLSHIFGSLFSIIPKIRRVLYLVTMVKLKPVFKRLSCFHREKNRRCSTTNQKEHNNPTPCPSLCAMALLASCTHFISAWHSS